MWGIRLDRIDCQKKIFINYVCIHGTRYAFELTKELADLGWDGHIVLSKNMVDIDNWRQINNIKRYEVDGYTDVFSFIYKSVKFFFCDARRIRKIVKDNQMQYSLVPILSFWTPFVQLLLGSTELTYVMHDPMPHEGHWFSGWLNKWMGRKASKIVVLSRIFEESTLSSYGKPVVTISEGVRITKDKQVLKKYSDSKVNFVFHGQASKYKGLDILAAVYAKLRDKYKNVTLTVAVSGHFESYQQYFDGLEDCDILNKRFTDEEVNGFFNDGNTICVLPYISATQSGVIPVAMMNGSPIIASACGGIPEQIEDGVTGWLVTPGDVQSLVDKMEYVINHRDEWENIRQAANEHIRSLDWTNIAKQFEEFIL